MYFGFVVVVDDVVGEKFGCVGDVGEIVGEYVVGCGFGYGECFFFCVE